MKRTTPPATFAEMLKTRDALDAEVIATGAKLRSYPRGNMGLTPDAVKATPEWKQDHAAFSSAMAGLRKFNTDFLRHYAKEWRAEHAARRIAPENPATV